jgi:hypothetical protein
MQDLVYVQIRSSEVCHYLDTAQVTGKFYLDTAQVSVKREEMLAVQQTS